jgi:hypothetical protein
MQFKIGPVRLKGSRSYIVTHLRRISLCNSEIIYTKFAFLYLNVFLYTNTVKLDLGVTLISMADQAASCNDGAEDDLVEAHTHINLRHWKDPLVKIPRQMCRETFVWTHLPALIQMQLSPGA